MQTSWQAINPTNNLFYWWNGTDDDTYYPIYIPQCSPGTITIFEDALEAALKSVFYPASGTENSTAVVSVDPSTLRVTLSPGNDLKGVNGTLNTDGHFVCFANRSSRDNKPFGVDELGYNSDSHEILGAYPTLDGSDRQNAALNQSGTAPSTGPGAHYFPLRANTHTLEAIYLRTGIESTNMQTENFTLDIPNTDVVTPSQLFARIPVGGNCSNSFGENIHITYLHGDDTFSMYPNTRSFDRLTFAIQDEQGRPIWIYRRDVNKAPMEFTCTLRVDICELEPSVNDETNAVLGAHDKQRVEAMVGKKKLRIEAGF